MISKLLLLWATLTVLQHSTTALLSVYKNLKTMSDAVIDQTETVTLKAADQDPTTLTEQAEIAEIIGETIDKFDNDYGEKLKKLMGRIDSARQNAGVMSPKALCLKLQEIRLEPARVDSQNRAKMIQADVDKRTDDLVENTRQLIENTKLDLQVKTIVQLCMKLYPKVHEGNSRLQCFDKYGDDLSISRKSRGETLLERVDTIQQASLRISNRAKDALQTMYVQNERAYIKLEIDVLKCYRLPKGK